MLFAIQVPQDEVGVNVRPFLGGIVQIREKLALPLACGPDAVHGSAILPVSNRY